MGGMRRENRRFEVFDKLSNFRTQVVSIGRDQKGAIAVIVALLVPVLAGVLALAIDLSRAANLQTELQDHADAAALSGATQLDNSDGSRARAIQAAAAPSLALAVNSQRFGDTAPQSRPFERGQCKRERSHGATGIALKVCDDPEVVGATADRCVIAIGVCCRERTLEVPRGFIDLATLEGDRA